MHRRARALFSQALFGAWDWAEKTGRSLELGGEDTAELVPGCIAGAGSRRRAACAAVRQGRPVGRVGQRRDASPPERWRRRNAGMPAVGGPDGSDAGSPRAEPRRS